MICEECLKEYIDRLVTADDTIKVSGQALSGIAEKYNIGKIDMLFAVSDSDFTKGGERKEYTLFAISDEVNETPSYSKQYQTGEGGNVQYTLYCKKGAETFSQENLRDLDVVLDILFFHCGRWRLINHVKKLTLTDKLTGLLNSGGFLSYAEELMNRKELQKYNAYYFNLARFSLVNRRFGAEETDTIIVRYAGELRKFIQDGECIGRLGGDNFVALILKERTAAFLEYISNVKTYGMLGEQKIPIEISATAGVFEIDESVVHPGMVIGECATALDIAKHIEKKPFVYASEEIRQKRLKERQVVSGFAEDLRNGNFKAYYQPKVETENYHIVGAEALARLEHNGKLVPPVEFVPILEQNGMICLLDFYILEQVCKDIRDWLKRGIEPVRISVNLSRKHLANPDLAENIMDILGKYELESKYIELELTETVDEAEAKQIIEFMKKMKKHKIALSIDDFGTGYSSLNLLRSFPVDVLKLDRTFLESLEGNDKIVLSNIIRMASELQMSVVAEGVETRQQMDCLRQLNCKVVQGFLFDKPMPRPVFEERMKKGIYEI